LMIETWTEVIGSHSTKEMLDHLAEAEQKHDEIWRERGRGRRQLSWPPARRADRRTAEGLALRGRALLDACGSRPELPNASRARQPRVARALAPLHRKGLDQSGRARCCRMKPSAPANTGCHCADTGSLKGCQKNLNTCPPSSAV
jgi:hypothetical protein